MKFPIYRIQLVFLLSAYCSAQIFAQGNPLPEQDCPDALVVCSPLIVQNRSYNGEGNNPNEINPQLSCLNVGEENGVWYQVNIV